MIELIRKIDKKLDRLFRKLGETKYWEPVFWILFLIPWIVLVLLGFFVW